MKFFLLFIISLFCLQLKAQNTDIAKTFVLTGKVLGRDTGYIILRYSDYLGKLINDTTYLQKGNFKFSGKIKGQPQRVTIIGPSKEIDFNEVNLVSVFLEPAVQNIILPEGDYEHAKMSGSFTQKQHDIFKEKNDSIFLKYKNLHKQLINSKYAYQNAKTEKEKSSILKKRSILRIKSDVEDSEIINLDIWFVKHYPDSYASPFVFYYPATILPIDSATRLFNGLTDNIKKSKSGKYISQLLKKRKENTVGSTAYNFTAVNNNGDSTALSDFRQKFVLLDFWASWCEPCIEQIPHLKRLYSRYQPKGFDIISISIDRDSNAWKKAISREKINNWQNVLANKDISDHYANVTNPIPSQILINREGKIVWKTGNKKSLEEELESLINPSKLD